MKIRRWILGLLVLIFIWLVISRLTEIETLAQTLAQGKWQWVTIAALLQILYTIVFASVYQAAFSTVQVNSKTRNLIPMLFAAVFINTAAPFGGTSGSALFVDDARRRGESPARAAAGTVLVQVADFGSFLILLIAGLLILFTHHDLKSYEILTAGVLLIIIGGLSSILSLGIWRPSLLEKILKWTQRLVNRIGIWFKQPELLTENWGEETTKQFTDASLAISAHPQKLFQTFGIALFSHLVNLVSLWAVCKAFNQNPGVGTLVAAYAMGILFWIVAIVPQGIGVVEGMMALVFTSLGTSASQATIIALAFRGLTFWLPLLIGFILMRRLPTFNPKAKPISDQWMLKAISVLTFLMGIINVLSAVTPSLPQRHQWLLKVSPLEILHGGRLTAALAGFALLLLSNQLRRRKRVAWWVTLFVLILSAVSHLVKGLDYEEASLALALAGWLFFLRDHFHAHSDPPSIRHGIQVLISALIFTFLYSIVGFYLLDHQFTLNYGLPEAIQKTWQVILQFSNPNVKALTPLGRYFVDSINIIGIVTLSYAAILLIRPVLVRQSASPAEKIKAKEIIEQYGKTVLAPFDLLDDKSYFFSNGGSLIAYIQEGRVALALGDPVGPSEDLSAAVQEFQNTCAVNDWLPAFYQVIPDTLKIYRQHGFQSLCVGEEGVVNLESFTMEGKENKGLRSGVHRLEKLGYTAQVFQPPIAEELMNELHDISDAWLTLMHGTEKRFSIGWFYNEYIGRCPILVVLDGQGRRIAFSNILTEYQKNEATIDMMRHRPEAEHGVMDFLFVSLFNWAREQGFETFNLGLSSLSGVGETENDPDIERALHYIYEHVDQFYNFKGLHQFKEKFHPNWAPRHLIYPTLADLPLVTLAMIRADSGDSIFQSYFRKI